MHNFSIQYKKIYCSSNKKNPVGYQCHFLIKYQRSVNCIQSSFWSGGEGSRGEGSRGEGRGCSDHFAFLVSFPSTSSLSQH